MFIGQVLANGGFTRCDILFELPNHDTDQL